MLSKNSMSLPKSDETGAVMASTNKFSKSITLTIVYINIALYATCFQIQRPLEPFLVEKISSSSATSFSGMDYAKLQSFFSVMQTVGSLIAGTFLDRFGVKGGFIISFLASAASYYLLSISTTMDILYISKIPTIFQAGFLCAQLAASQATSDGEERVRTLGRLTLSYTIGSVLGPALGGHLGASGDYYLGARLAVWGSLLSVVLTLFMPSPSQTLKPATTDESYSDLQQEDDKSTAAPPKSPSSGVAASILNVVRATWLLLAAKGVTSIANAMGTTVFPLVLKGSVYKLDERSLGYAMSAMSGFNGVVSGFLLGPIVSFVGGKLTRVITLCIFFMAIISVAIAVIGSPVVSDMLVQKGLYEFLGLTFVLSMFQFVLSTTVTGESTAVVKPYDKGTLLGIEHSLFAAARVVAPQSGVLLLSWGGLSAVSAACSGIYFLVLTIWNSYSPNLEQQVLKSSVKKTEGGERKER